MHLAEERARQLAAWMDAAQRGDREAYRRLLQALLPLLRHWVRRSNSRLPREEVEDLVQEILLSVHTARFTYDPRRPLLPWLAALARYRMADAARRRVRTGRNEVSVDEYPETSGEEFPNSGEGFGDAEALRLAILALPAGQRSAVELLKLRELSLKEASAVSGASVGALKTAMHRALQSLRVVLRGKGLT